MKILCPPEKLTKNVVYPIVQPVTTEPPTNWFAKIWKFLSYCREWRLIDDYVIWSNYLQKYIYCPAGFVFNGASVPKILHSLYGPTGILFIGSVPHDFGYKYGGLLIVDESTREISFICFTKTQLDLTFNELCAHESGLPASTKAATVALTLLGFIAWNTCRQEGASARDDFPELEF